jgi:hypothetical protein
MAAGVGDDGGGTVGGVEAEGGVGNGVGATGLGMVRRGRGWRQGSGMMTGALSAASRPKAGSKMGLARWRSVEGGERGTEGGGGTEGGKLGQSDGANQNFTVIRVSHRRGYSPYTRYVIGIG